MLLSGLKLFITLISRCCHLFMHAIQTILLFVAINLVKPDNRAQFIVIEKTGCTFLVQSPNSNFTFLSCNTPTASALNNWVQCINQCCPMQKNYANDPPNLSILSLCQTSSTISQGLNLSTIIVFSVVTLVGASMFLCFCCIIVRILTKIKKNRITQQIQENVTIQWQAEQKNLTKDSYQLKWCKKGKNNSLNIFSDAPCSICLEDNPNSELFCRHKYHDKCIGQWLSKSSFCPLCHRSDIRSIKIYCEKCYSQYIICRKGFLVSLRTVAQNQCIECSQKDKELQVNEQVYSRQQIVLDISSQNILEAY